MADLRELLPEGRQRGLALRYQRVLVFQIPPGDAAGGKPLLHDVELLALQLQHLLAADNLGAQRRLPDGRGYNIGCKRQPHRLQFISLILHLRL